MNLGDSLEGQKDILGHWVGDGAEGANFWLSVVTALVRFWTLVCLAYVFLEEQNASLRLTWPRHVTLGETRRFIQQRHWHLLLDWLHDPFALGTNHLDLHSLMVA